MVVKTYKNINTKNIAINIKYKKYSSCKDKYIVTESFRLEKPSKTINSNPLTQPSPQLLCVPMSSQHSLGWNFQGLTVELQKGFARPRELVIKWLIKLGMA